MEKPIITMTDEIKDMACKLYKTAKEIGLGNVGFKYSNNGGFDIVKVYIEEYRNHWECNVVMFKGDGKDKERIVDMYDIDENGLRFKGTEID